jgi:SAM-dependent methyltransferase
MLPVNEIQVAADSEYDRFAIVYDRWMAEDFCRRALPVVESLLLNQLPPGSAILDVCCGGGQMARTLVQRGYRVTGLDCSPRMLALATENVPQAKFLLADAREFDLPPVFDSAISTFNSLAHVETTEDLTRVFKCVYRALRPGSFFLFDLSMEEAYSSKWRGSFSVVEDNHACIVRPLYDPQTRIASNCVTLFEARLSVWQRTDFTITQKCHDEREVRAALAAAGFNEVKTFDAENDVGMTGENGRCFFLCR